MTSSSVILPFGVSIKVNPPKINYLQTRMVDKRKLKRYNVSWRTVIIWLPQNNNDNQTNDFSHKDTNDSPVDGYRNGYGNIYNAFCPSTNGTAVTMTGEVKVPDGCYDFKITFNNPTFLNLIIKYIKIIANVHNTGAI